MSKIWSDEHRFEVWKDVEAFALAAWADQGIVPQEAAEAALNASTPTPAEVIEREAVTNHDMAAFVDILAANTSTGGEWIHFGLTSSDVLDTAGGVLMRDAADLLLEDIKNLYKIVKARAFEHRSTLMIGRTHGIWAEPTSFGLKLATWAFELSRDYRRMLSARDSIAVGKISGAVGTYAHTPPEIEARVCERLGIGVEPASSQVTHRDRHAEFLQAIALTGASIERFATEIRHLQRSEVREAREAFGSGQKGSSAMPHKRNPIMSERMVGMARLLRGYALTGLENVSLWHERDISHSSAERVAIPDACLTLDYMLTIFANLVEHLVVDSDRMAENLASTYGLVYSQAVLLEVVKTGIARDQAYRIVQRNAMRAWDEQRQLLDLLKEDPEVGLDKDLLDSCFSAERFLTNSEIVFERLEASQL